MHRQGQRAYAARVRDHGGHCVHGKQGLDRECPQFPEQPYDENTLGEWFEQARTLMQDAGAEPKVAIVDLGYRGRAVEVRRGEARSLTRPQWRWIKRRQVEKPVIGYLKQEHRLDR